MARTGPRPKPPLQVVREGNPGKRPVREGVKLPPVGALSEPEWLAFFPAVRVPKGPSEPAADAPDRDLVAYDRLLAEWRRKREAAAATVRCRAAARAEWVRVVPMLVKSAGLAEVDLAVVVDYCVTVARLAECERQLSLLGLVVMGQKGECRNPLTTVAAQYRSQLKAYIGELGLSPSARGRLEPSGDGDGEDDPFD